jgi:glutathione synthase
MLDAPTNTIKQVEFNTISSSFGGLSTLVSALHTHLLTSPTPAYPAHPVLHPQALPPNNAIASLASGLASAHEAYGLSKSHPALPCCILILTQDPNERNIFDQLHLTSALQSPPYCIPVFRLPISDILTLTTIPDSNLSRPLIYKPPHSPHTPYEVTTLYLRALYSPTDHPTPSSWEARLHLERSLAIKCPSILLQLAGCKKVQQVLATPLPTSTKIDPPSDTSSDPAVNPPPNSEDPLSHFLPNYSPHTISLLRSTFAPQYALSSERGTSLALDPTTARNHVLKPQREGGGNNIYHEDITKYLNSLSLSPSSHPSDPSSSSSDTKAEEIKSKTAEYARWVLMELIHPPTSAHNTILKSNGSVVSAPTVSELGIFGIALWENPSIATPIPESQRPSLTTVSSTDSEDIPVFDEYKPKEELMKVDEGIEAVLLPSKERARPQILVNEEAGWLLRTKGQDSDEGGVATGFACVDSVVLVDL